MQHIFSLKGQLFREERIVKSEKRREQKRTKETTTFCRKLSFLLAHPRGFEPPTCRLGVQRLGYEGKWCDTIRSLIAPICI